MPAETASTNAGESAAAPDWRAGALALARRFPLRRLAPAAVDALAERARAAEPEPVAVACSGGADSLAALLLAWAHFPALRARLAVLHFNHGTRPECAAEAGFVRAVAAALGADFRAGEMPARVAAAARAGLLDEAALRRHRLAFFHAACASLGARVLAQGHHADDALESVLLRLARGAGAEGLAAPRAVQTFRARPLVFVRPLMTLQKADIAAALREAGLPWREDASNASGAHERNRLRRAAVPAWKAAAGARRLAAGLARSQRLLDEDAAAREAWADSLWREIAARSPSAALGIFDWSPARAAPAALHRRLFRRALSLAPADDAEARLDTAVAEDIAAALAGGRAGRWNSARGGAAVFDGAALSLSRAAPRRAGRAFRGSGVLLPDGGGLFWPDGGVLSCAVVPVAPALFAAVCAGRFPSSREVFLALRENAPPPALTARFWRDGDAYRPLGAAGRRKLSDVFREKKVPVSERRRLPVVLQGEVVVWAPGLPPAEEHRLVLPSGLALRLTWSPAASTSCAKK
jgi:tRNA(Ile)-lysidine synthase